MAHQPTVKRILRKAVVSCLPKCFVSGRPIYFTFSVFQYLCQLTADEGRIRVLITLFDKFAYLLSSVIISHDLDILICRRQKPSEKLLPVSFHLETQMCMNLKITVDITFYRSCFWLFFNYSNYFRYFGRASQINV